jgi:hypothetical protein
VDKPQKRERQETHAHHQPQDQVLQAASKKAITRIYVVD